MPSTTKFAKFFDEIRELQKKIKAQKKRGLNDFNLLTTVLPYHDEVRLHSRTIKALLNPQGTHYQDELFLEIFLKTIGFKGLNLKTTKVYLEYKNIDLYITDGIKHIIIENKVWARDENKQIERYVNKIKEENLSLEADDLIVIYLSIDRNQPSDYSLGDLKVDGDKLIDKSKTMIAHYKSIHYKKEILKWLKESQFEVQNITNLNESIGQYIDVVEMLNNNYKGKVMTLEDYLKEEPINWDLAKSIANEFNNLEKQVVTNFINNIYNRLKNKYKAELIIELNHNNIDKQWARIINLYDSKYDGKKHINISLDFYQKLDVPYMILSRSNSISKINLGKVFPKIDFPDFNCITHNGGWHCKFHKIDIDNILFSKWIIIKGNEEKFFNQIVKYIDNNISLVEDINTRLNKLP